MDKARATLVCKWCGKPYDPNDEKWACEVSEKGVSYFTHVCEKYRVSFTYPDDIDYKHKGLADRVKAAFLGAMK